jgi:hypothetical protein
MQKKIFKYLGYTISFAYLIYCVYCVGTNAYATGGLTTTDITTTVGAIISVPVWCNATGQSVVPVSGTDVPTGITVTYPDNTLSGGGSFHGSIFTGTIADTAYDGMTTAFTNYCDGGYPTQYVTWHITSGGGGGSGSSSSTPSSTPITISSDSLAPFLYFFVISIFFMGFYLVKEIL